jgi:hypothetical protein
MYPDTTELVEELDITTNEILGMLICIACVFSEEVEAVQGVRRGQVGVGDRRAPASIQPRSRPPRALRR